MAELTPSQTIGPFLHIGLPWPDGPLAAPEDTPGAVTISGRVTDGAGEPVPDALVETWQVPADGLRGFGRCPTDADGRYHVVTVRPEPLAAPGGGTEAPHLDVSIFARGLLRRLVTRIYFPDAPENDADPVLLAVDPDRRGTLVASPADGGYAFDIRLQGDGETVFFDV